MEAKEQKTHTMSDIFGWEKQPSRGGLSTNHGMLDLLRKQGDLGAGYAQVFTIPAVLALAGDGLSLLLRPKN